MDQIVEPIQGSDSPVVSPSQGAVVLRPWTFDAVYEAHASFVWRMAIRLGIPHSAGEDVMQDVFLVVYRRLPAFEERTSVRAWLSAIVIRVVRAHRRATRRRGQTSDKGASVVDPDMLPDMRARSALEMAEQTEAVRELHDVLSCMKQERREALVLSELEQLTSPEIASALQVNVNTIYFRLRTARREFERILFRRRAVAARGNRR